LSAPTVHFSSSPTLRKSSVTSDGGGVISIRIAFFATEVDVERANAARRRAHDGAAAHPVFRGCMLCEASCRLALELEGDRIIGGQQ
jgi:hypothetical protein